MENNNTQQPPPPPPGERQREDNNNNNNQQYLKQLNKLSHKISKPPIRKPPPPPPEQTQVGGPQPPVYNINKCDFRDIVQKLTGSPSHSLIPAPSSASSSNPTSSRLHRIRPPPLSQLTNRPPGTLQMPPPFFNPIPLSPLPPLPSVHAAVESPVSAYMRFLGSSSAGGFPEPTRQFSPLVSPRWNSLAGPPQPDQSQPAGWMFPQLPSGCMSPLSTAAPYPPMPSPTVPVPSPKGRGL